MIKIFQQLQQYNFWSQKPQNLGYIRNLYTKKIFQFVDNPLIKVLIGQRRTGKSYILRQIISQLIQQGIHPKNIFYLNKEYIEFDDIKTYQNLHKLLQIYEKQLSPQGKIYIFLDEIQQIQNWEKLINSLAQHQQNKYEIFITGSNSQLLSSEIATLLSGRYIQFDIYPFNYHEYLGIKKTSTSKQSYLNYMNFGGLPELFNLQSTETQRQYVTSLRDSIVLKDIVQKYKIKDVYLLEQLFLFFTNNVGNLTSINKIVGYLKSHKIKTNFETLSNYTQYLKQAILIHEAQRYDIRGKNLLDGERKYFLNDVAFRSYLSSNFDPGLGQRLENTIYLHYLSQGYSIFVGTLLNKEVDFVLEKDSEKKYVQVAYSMADAKTAKREFASLEKISDAYEKIVISLDDVSFGNKNGIKHLLAWEL